MRDRAGMTHTRPALGSAAAGTKLAAQRARAALGAADLAGRAAGLTAALRRRYPQNGSDGSDGGSADQGAIGA